MQRLEVSANACSVITSLKGLYCFLFLSPIRGTPCTVTPKCLSPGHGLVGDGDECQLDNRLSSAQVSPAGAWLRVGSKGHGLLCGAGRKSPLDFVWVLTIPRAEAIFPSLSPSLSDFLFFM